MKNFLVKAKNKVCTLSTKAKLGLTSAMLAVSSALATVPGFASEDTSVVQITEDTDPNKLMGGIIDQLCNVALYVGIGLVGFGLFQLFMAFKDEDAGSKSRAMMLVGVGIVLIGLKSALDVMGVISAA